MLSDEDRQTLYKTLCEKQDDTKGYRKYEGADENTEENEAWYEGYNTGIDDAKEIIRTIGLSYDW